MITIDLKQMERVEFLLKTVPDGVPIAVSSAINRAAQGARTDAVRKVRERYHIKAGEVRDTIRIAEATKTRLSATVKSRDTRRELIQFRVRPGEPKHNNPPAVLRVAVTKNGIKDLPRAFVARGTKTNKVHVLKRVGNERYPIHIKYGPAVPEMLGHESVTQFIEEQAQERLEKRLNHEIFRLLRGVGK